MVQLANDRTTIITSDCLIRKPKTELEHVIKEKIKEDITASDFLQWKIIICDNSDNIPGVPGIGEKTAVKLLNELMLHPRTGTGHPEQLKGDRTGQWSRTITKKHRLIYEIFETEVYVDVLSAYGHYNDK